MAGVTTKIEKSGRVWERKSNRLQQNKRHSLLPYKDWKGETKRMEGKDRKRRFGDLLLLGWGDRNWDPLGLQVHRRGEMG